MGSVWKKTRSFTDLLIKAYGIIGIFTNKSGLNIGLLYLLVLTMLARSRTADSETTAPARLLQKDVSSLISNVVCTDFLFRNISPLRIMHYLTSHWFRTDMNIEAFSRIILRIFDQAMT